MTTLEQWKKDAERLDDILSKNNIGLEHHEAYALNTKLLKLIEVVEKQQEVIAEKDKSLQGTYKKLNSCGVRWVETERVIAVKINLDELLEAALSLTEKLGDV